MSEGESSGFRLIGTDTRPSLGLTRPQRHAVFREMVAGELRRGGMSRRRWQRLVQYGALLDLSAVEAGEVIAQARESIERAEPFALRLTPPGDGAKATASWPLWVKVSLGCAMLAIADATVFHWFF
ncbi:MAG: hypothetical protein JXB13_16805 [Phycisphaerae bacterium]|nr:hypothetical protein [Phycisphaerae bacterium]